MDNFENENETPSLNVGAVNNGFNAYTNVTSAPITKSVNKKKNKMSFKKTAQQVKTKNTILKTAFKPDYKAEDEKDPYKRFVRFQQEALDVGIPPGIILDLLHETYAGISLCSHQYRIKLGREHNMCLLAKDQLYRFSMAMKNMILYTPRKASQYLKYFKKDNPLEYHFRDENAMDKKKSNVKEIQQ